MIYYLDEHENINVQYASPSAKRNTPFKLRSYAPSNRLHLQALLFNHPQKKYYTMKQTGPLQQPGKQPKLRVTILRTSE